MAMDDRHPKPGMIRRLATRRGFSRLLFSVALIGVLALVVTYVGLQVLGYRFYEVRSSSMVPALRKGDIVAVKAVEPRLIAGGDVIAFRTTGGLTVVHRVREIESAPDLHSVFKDRDGKLLKEKWDYAPRTFYTKGDANADPDINPVPQSALLGTVRFTVPTPFDLFVTRVSRQTMFFLGAACMMLFITWEAADWALARRRIRRVSPARSGPIAEGRP